MPRWNGHDAADVAAAAQALAAGQLVAFATETVYGLGARADDDRAVARIFTAKGRPSDHPLIVHLADAADADAFTATLSPAAQQLMAAFWPGPLTLIVPRRAGVAEAAAGGHPSIGLRLPSHPVARALLRQARKLGVPGVAAPSANRYGRISPTRAEHVEHEFGAALPVLDGGACSVGIESAIVDCTGAQPALLRPGQLLPTDLARVLQAPLGRASARSAAAPGTLPSHYAPRARLSLIDASELDRRALSAAPAPFGGVGVYSRHPGRGVPGWRERRMPDEAPAAAHALFAVLRELDDAGVSAIWVEPPPAGAEWDGVRDRLTRAAA